MPKPLWTPSDTPAKEFAKDVTPALELIFRNSARQAAVDNGLTIDWTFIDPEAKRYAAERGAEMVGMKWVNGRLVENPNAAFVIDDTIRDGVRDMLAEALEEGWSFQEFSDHLEEAGLFGEARSTLIARTEMAIAMNVGRVSSYRMAGYEWVVVSDAAECGGDECDVDGEVWTLEEAEEEPLGHPNCTRSFRPATKEESEEADEEEAA